MFQRLHELVNIHLDFAFWEVVASASYPFIEVLVHQFEYQREAACRFVAAWWVLEDLDQLDDVGVWGKSAQGLNFAEVVDLL